MARKRSTILMVIIGIVVCIFVVGAGTATWFYLSVFDSVDADEAVATRSFDEARARFKGQQPILELRDDKVALLRKAPDIAPARELQSVHVLTWNAEEGTLSTVTLPFWLLRLQDSGVDVSIDADGTRLTMTMDEVERYGPALVLDHLEEDGSRVLVWTE
jgi:hypothetical protein